LAHVYSESTTVKTTDRQTDRQTDMAIAINIYQLARTPNSKINIETDTSLNVKQTE